MKFIFIMTHLGAGHDSLYHGLKNHNVCCVQTNKVYTHPSDLDSLKSLDNYAKCYIDTILYNYSLCSTAFYKFCKFIYLIRNPKESFNYMQDYSEESAMSYYLFRLRRMYEMANKTGGLFLTYEDMCSEEGGKLLQEFLELKQLPKVRAEEMTEMNVSERGYGKYLAMFKRLNLNKV